MHYGENYYRQTFEGRILHPLEVLLLAYKFEKNIRRHYYPITTKKSTDAA